MVYEYHYCLYGNHLIVLIGRHFGQQDSMKDELILFVGMELFELQKLVRGKNGRC